jgi:hypothetical protein
MPTTTAQLLSAAAEHARLRAASSSTAASRGGVAPRHLQAAAARASVSKPAKPSKPAAPRSARRAAVKPAKAPAPKPRAERLIAPVSAGGVFEVLCARAKAADPVARRVEVAGRFPALRDEYRSDEIAGRSRDMNLNPHEEKGLPITALIADEIEKGCTLIAARDRVAAARPDLVSDYCALTKSRLAAKR